MSEEAILPTQLGRRFFYVDHSSAKNKALPLSPTYHMPTPQSSLLGRNKCFTLSSKKQGVQVAPIIRKFDYWLLKTQN